MAARPRRNGEARVVQPVRTGDSFQNASARLGWGTNNQSSASQYTLSYQSRNRINLEAAYRGSWIVAAAVDAIPEDMTRCGIEMTGIGPGEISTLEADMVTLGIWDRICETGKWARLYGGAVAVMLIEGQDLSTPLRTETVGKGDFKGLLVLDRWMISPPTGEVVTEYGPDLGKPMYYDVIAAYAAIPKAKIHYSRVIRLDGGDLPFYQRISENGWGLSVLEPLWDRLIAFDSASVGAGQLVYKAHLRVVKVKKLREVIGMGGPGLAALQAQMEFIRLGQSNEGLTVIDADDDFVANTYSFAGLSDMLIQFAQQLSGALGIPLSRLFGQSPQGLSDTGEGPRRQYHEKVHQKQEKDLRTGLQRLLAVLSMSSLGKPLTDEFKFSFKGLDDTPETDKADIASKKVTSILAALEAGVISKVIALRELMILASITGLFGSITDKDITEAENEPPPPAMDPPAPEVAQPGQPDPTQPDPQPKSGTMDSLLQFLRKWKR